MIDQLSYPGLLFSALEGQGRQAVAQTLTRGRGDRGRGSSSRRLCDGRAQAVEAYAENAKHATAAGHLLKPLPGEKHPRASLLFSLAWDPYHFGSSRFGLLPGGSYPFGLFLLVVHAFLRRSCFVYRIWSCYFVVLPLAVVPFAVVGCLLEGSTSFTAIEALLPGTATSGVFNGFG
jgi:hypothetical protein